MNIFKLTNVPAALFILFCSNVNAQFYNLSTPSTSIIIEAPQNGEAKLIYYGTKVSAEELNEVKNSGFNSFSAYPVYGMNCQSETALAVRHHDGNMSLQMEVIKVESTDNDNYTQTVLHLKDKVYPFYVNINYKAYNKVDMIETWTEITNKEKGTVTLNQFSSGYMPIRRGNVWLSSLYGSWANEGRLCQEELIPGMKIIKNKDGVRNSHTAHAEVMFSLDGKPQENYGRTIGAALCYGGNYKLRIDTDDSEYHHFFAGINEENSAYNLKKNETFTTPLNSWEGVYFDINQQGMEQMINDISSMGGELFVMDDGWFGDKYQRNTDNSSLGDWVVDKKKLPEGIESLIKASQKKNIDFGIWIEPEMTNTKSELYEKHPEWIIKSPKRDAITGRGGTQLVLDMGNPEVQDFVYEVVDKLMTENPEIDYIKWDANMGILNHGSNYLTNDNQSHLYIEYHRGFEKVCQRIRNKYKDLTIQACASGGGRANYGYLPYFDEFWVSDNTDALQRIYMQWGTSYFFPSIAMASHISAAPNHQTFRTIPLKYRIDVAMSGRLGMEIQPKNMTQEEKELCRKAISEYKTIRPVVQFGDIYRLKSPYDKDGFASLMYVSPEKDKAVFYWWKTETFVNQHLPVVTMKGLNPNKRYMVKEINRIDNEPLIFEGKTFTGKFLMSKGLEIPYTHKVDYHKLNDYASRILYLIETK